MELTSSSSSMRTTKKPTGTEIKRRRKNSATTISISISISIPQQEVQVVSSSASSPSSSSPSSPAVPSPPLAPSVGLIFEYGHGHFDRANRLQRERPARIVAVEAALRDAGLLARCTTYQTREDILQSPEDYHAVHAPAYLQRLNQLSRWCGGSFCRSCTDPTGAAQQQQQQQHRLDQEAAQYSSVFLTADSYRDAQRAVRALCTLTDQVLFRRRPPHDKERQQPPPPSYGFAIIRPPGHHAEPHGMGGYCLLNNVATAVQYVKSRCQQQPHPQSPQQPRILIVDWDVHHGNGTQQIFITDPTVLYFSIHRANIYPSFGPNAAGRASDVGTGHGRGYTVNCPWRTKGMGDDEYICAVQHILLPIIDQFQPTLVFISAGFDAADGDLGECCVTPQGFATLTRLIRHQLLLLSQQHDRRADRDRTNNTTNTTTVPILCALEGGYVRSMLAQCVVAVVEALLEDEHDLKRRLPPSSSSSSCSSPPLIDRIAPQARLDIESTIRNHQGHWKLRPVIVETPLLLSSSSSLAGTVPTAKKAKLG